MKAVREGGSEERGRVLWDATSRGLCGRVGPPRTTYVWHGQTVREDKVGEAA